MPPLLSASLLIEFDSSDDDLSKEFDLLVEEYDCCLFHPNVEDFEAVLHVEDNDEGIDVEDVILFVF